jgi:hypothetical protein
MGTGRRERKISVGRVSIPDTTQFRLSGFHTRQCQYPIIGIPYPTRPNFRLSGFHTRHHPMLIIRVSIMRHIPAPKPRKPIFAVIPPGMGSRGNVGYGNPAYGDGEFGGAAVFVGGGNTAYGDGKFRGRRSLSGMGNLGGCGGLCRVWKPDLRGREISGVRRSLSGVGTRHTGTGNFWGCGGLKDRKRIHRPSFQRLQ